MIWAAVHVAVGRSTPVVVPGAPVALDLGLQLTDQNLDAIWVLDREGFSTVSPRSDGGGSVTHRTQLPTGTDPVAIDSDGTRALILDRATNAVLVFDGGEDAGFSLSATLPVGNRPSALGVWDFNSDGEYDLAVANEGSDDVSVILAGPGGTFLPQRRLAVGSQPRALAVVGGRDLAVANFGSGSVSILGGDGTGGFPRRSDVRVGAGPAAIGTVWESEDLPRSGFDGFVVADALDGTVVAIRGTRATGRVTLPGGAVSQPAAVTLNPSRANDGFDVVVAARGRVFAVPLSAQGRFGSPAVRLATPHPVAVLAGDFGGDRWPDFAVADATGRVAFLVSPGARVISPDPSAARPAARGGLVMWSRHSGHREYRLASRSGDLPVTASEAPLAPRIGRARDGTAVVTYSRCRRGRCRAFAWSPGHRRERRITIETPHGCTLKDAAVWRASMAYLFRSAPGGICPPAVRGLWLRRGSGTPLRLSAHADRLGDLRGGTVSWFDSLQGGDAWRLRVKRHGGKATTIADENIESTRLNGGALDGHFVYFGVIPEGRSTLFRVALAGQRSQYLPPRDGFPAKFGNLRDPQFAIDAANVFYADDFGIFEMRSQDLRWR